MIRSIQIKIILIVIILATLMFCAYGIYSITSMQTVATQTIEKEQLLELIHNFKVVLGILLVGFIVISLIIIWFTKKIFQNQF